MEKIIDIGVTLTATQIRDLDEIGADKNAIGETLKIAMQFHSNRSTEIAKKEKAWWLGLGEIHGLDFENEKYKVSNEGPICKIVKIEE